MSEESHYDEITLLPGVAEETSPVVSGSLSPGVSGSPEYEEVPLMTPSGSG